jgi:hypothetical protein
MAMIQRQDIPQRKFPLQSRRGQIVVGSGAEAERNDGNFVRINVRYLNAEGRNLALNQAAALHYDFGHLSPIINITIPRTSLSLLQSNPNIEYAGGDGAVIFL